MICTLVGTRDTRFTNEKTGELVSGQTIFVTYEDSYVDGVRADKFFLPEKRRIFVDCLPAVIDIQFNRYGKIDSVKII